MKNIIIYVRNIDVLNRCMNFLSNHVNINYNPMWVNSGNNYLILDLTTKETTINYDIRYINHLINQFPDSYSKIYDFEYSKEQILKIIKPKPQPNYNPRKLIFD